MLHSYTHVCCAIRAIIPRISIFITRYIHAAVSGMVFATPEIGRTHDARKSPWPFIFTKELCMTAHDSKGFEITLHDAKHLIRIRTWGDWNRELLKTCGEALQERVDSLCGNSATWNILVDATALSPQSDDAQRIMCEQITAASQRKIRRIAYLGTGVTVRFRSDPPAQEAEFPQYACFATYEGAVRWLLSENV